MPFPQVRPKNMIKDFVHVAGLLKVSHLIMFTKTVMGPYLKVSKGGLPALLGLNMLHTGGVFNYLFGGTKNPCLTKYCFKKI